MNGVMKLQTFLERLDGVKQTKPDQYIARCPSHDDNVASLSISVGDEKINFFDHAGCSGDEILDAIGLDWSDVYFEDEKQSRGKKTIVKTYNYNDKSGKLLFQVVRFQPKTFRQRRPDGKGGWNWGLGDVEPVLYRLKRLYSAISRGDTIYYVEGEKDADNLNMMGLTATTNPMGAGKWKKSYTDMLDGAKVVIIPDNDKPGKDHAKKVANNLYSKAKMVKILELPGLDNKEDVSDWIEKGNSKDDLIKLEKDCPVWKPDSPQKGIGNEFESFLPTPIAETIIKQEKQNDRLWKYVAEKDLFYFYNTAGYWRMQQPEYLRKYIRQHLRQFNEKWDTNHRVTEIISALKSLLLDPQNSKLFDAGNNPNRDYINVENGMIEWRKEKLLEHDPKYYSQFQLPVNYDPEADCSHWEKAMKDWVPEKEARMFLQEFTGYCLIPDTAMHKAVILTGDGSNGKSTFLNVLINLFGRDNLSGIPLHRFTGSAGRFETANIQGKLVNIMSDIDPTYLKETGVIKTMIAGEELRGEYKHGASFDFTPVVRLIFSANEIPKARDRTEAWYRRFEIVKFPNTFRKDDPNFDPYLEEKLEKELPGILNWAIAGLKRLKENRNFTQSEMIKEAKREYERENDSVVAFIEDRTKTPIDDYEVCQHVYREYQIYCENAGMKYTTRRTFTSRLKKLGYEVKNKWKDGKTQRCYYGLRLI